MEAVQGCSGDTLLDTRITRPKRKPRPVEEAGERRSGLWSAKELQTLKDNIAEFLKVNNLKDPASIIFSERTPLRTEFFRSIARNIERPAFAVYRKVCRDFDAENYIHQWSDELTEQLLVQHSIHGNKWSKIGRTLGVSPGAARDRYRQVTGREHAGEWAPEEEERLLAAMKRLHGEDVVKEVVVSSSASWERVAKLVKTRNSVQCRNKWLYTIFQEQNSGQEIQKWTAQQDLDLLHKLCEEGAEDEEEVDWSALSHHWHSIRSSHHLRTKWACLRRRVPGYEFKSFEENLEHLMEHLVPILNLKLKELKN